MIYHASANSNYSDGKFNITLNWVSTEGGLFIGRGGGTGEAGEAAASPDFRG